MTSRALFALPSQHFTYHTMSYHIVQRIRLLNEEVYVTGADNNVSPRTPHEWKSATLTDAYRTGGKDTLDTAIMKAYEEGNFQPGRKNKYTRAVERARNSEEYRSTYDWRRIADYSENDHIYRNRMNEAALGTFLLNALRASRPHQPDTP